MTPREEALTRELGQCKAELSAAQRQIEVLRQKVDWLVRRVFGSMSEKLDPAQLELLLHLPHPSTTPTPAAQADLESPTRVTPHRAREPRLPEHLPVVEEIIEPEVVKAEPEAWRCIGEEVSEQLDYEPARFVRRRLIRRRYVHRTLREKPPVIADLPERLLDRSLPAPGLLAYILVSKYCDHIPLYRLEQIFKNRHGIRLSRQSMCRWMALAGDWLQPIYEHIRTGVMGGGYAQLDETPIRFLEPGLGRTRQGFLWTGNRPGGDVFFHWESSRATACLERIVPTDFRGVLQTDGYVAYRAFAASRGSAVQLAACWAHARRKFHEALELCPRAAGWFMRQIQHLYRVEAGLREHHAGPRLRAAVRGAQSRPIVERVGKALLRLKTRGRYLPQSTMGQAIDYALGQWPGLGLFLDDGRLEIDNNQVENSIRPTAVGKKNWLFFGAEDTGQRSAIIYTIVETCRRKGIDPYVYLKDVLRRLPAMTNHQIPTVVPGTWIAPLNPAS